MAMATFLEMNLISQTASDSPQNRFKEFMMYGTAQFMQRASTEILISLDKNNAKSKKCSKYLAKCIDIGVTGLSALGGLGPMSKGIGGASGKVTEEFINEIVKNKAHKKSKRIEKFLEGFDPESELWIKFVLNCFADLFIK